MGVVLPLSQFWRVLRLTPSCAAIVFWASPALVRCSAISCESSERFIAKGGESCLTALIINWQKGRTNHPFRQQLCSSSQAKESLRLTPNPSVNSFQQRQPRGAVASRVLCKSWERVTGPMGIHSVKDAK
jgi:hypothetical protein